MHVIDRGTYLVQHKDHYSNASSVTKGSLDCVHFQSNQINAPYCCVVKDNQVLLLLDLGLE
jgi:hypothetical protein